MNEIVSELKSVYNNLKDAPAPIKKSHSRKSAPIEIQQDRISRIYDSSPDPSISKRLIQSIDVALSKQGYLIKQCLGRVKTHPIFLVVPSPDLIRNGTFPDVNSYPKIVTAEYVPPPPEEQQVLDLWFGRYLPILHKVRKGLFTSLFNTIFDEKSRHMLIFSEYVDDPYFGTDLLNVDIPLRCGLALGYLVTKQIEVLHEYGMAHHNVHAKSLLLKGIRASRSVQPAMVGLVAPTFKKEELASDIRNLSDLILSWMSQKRIAALDPIRAHSIRLCRQTLVDMAHMDRSQELSLSELFRAISSGMTALDKNFAVLEKFGGDVDGYCQLIVSQELYGRLW